MPTAKELFQNLETPVTALEKTRAVVNRLVGGLVQSVRAMSAGPVSGNSVVGVYESLIAARGHFDRLRNLPGLRDAVARDFGENGKVLLDASDDIYEAIIGAISYVASTFPGEGDWVVFEDGGVQTRSYSVSETAGLRAALNSVISLVV